MILIRNIAVLILFLTQTTAFSQQSNYLVPLLDKSTLNEGDFLIQHRAYGSAYHLSDHDLVKTSYSQHSLDLEKGLFQRALASYYLSLPSTENQLLNIKENHTESSYNHNANFLLCKIYFRNKEYDKAFQNLELINENLLTDQEKAELFFQRGYIYLTRDSNQLALNDLEKANIYRSTIKEDVTFYKAISQYNLKQYVGAEPLFNTLTGHPLYSETSYEYIVQILLVRRAFQQIIDLDKKVTLPKTTTVNKAIGDSYFSIKDYKKALGKYYQVKNPEKFTGMDSYRIGYTIMESKNYKKAIPFLENATIDNDAVAQNAYYQLGWCYIQTNQTDYATNCYQKAYQLNFDKEVKEISLLNYARLSYENSKDPYSKAIIDLESYIQNNPSSDKLEDIQKFLIGIYSTTKNYKQIITSTEKFRTKSPEIQKAYQRACFFRGQEELNDGNFKEADKLFAQALKNPLDTNLEHLTYYYMGESSYKQKNYQSAINHYNNVLSQKEEGIEESKKALYNIAYCYFNKEDFSNAHKYFQLFLGQTKIDNTLKEDAIIRNGDVLFMQKKYADAEKNYKLASIKSVEKEYALFQTAICAGLLDKKADQEKINKELISKYPKSSYAEKVSFNLAQTYSNEGKELDAIEWYEKFITDYPNSTLKYEAYNTLGLIYYNKENYDKALEQYNQTIVNNPQSPEGKIALGWVRRIYADKGEVNGYEKYTKKVGLENLPESELDSTAYEVAERLYLEEKCDKAVFAFEDYIAKHPNGFFVLNAQYNKANCEVKNGAHKNALKSYDYVLKQPNGKYSELAAVKAMRISEQDKNSETTEKYALKVLEKSKDENYTLEANNILLKANKTSKKYSEALENAKAIASNTLNNDATTNLTVKLLEGLLLKEQKNYSAAVKKLEEVSSSNSQLGAEAFYEIAESHYLNKNYKKCETTLYDLADKMSSYEYWVAKGFILLGDNLLKQGNKFQARETYKSVADNYNGEDLKKIAKQKYNSLK